MKTLLTLILFAGLSYGFYFISEHPQQIEYSAKRFCKKTINAIDEKTTEWGNDIKDYTTTKVASWFVSENADVKDNINGNVYTDNLYELNYVVDGQEKTAIIHNSYSLVNCGTKQNKRCFLLYTRATGEECKISGKKIKIITTKAL